MGKGKGKEFSKKRVPSSMVPGIYINELIEGVVIRNQYLYCLPSLSFDYGDVFDCDENGYGYGGSSGGGIVGDNPYKDMDNQDRAPLKYFLQMILWYTFDEYRKTEILEERVD